MTNQEQPANDAANDPGESPANNSQPEPRRKRPFFGWNIAAIAAAVVLAFALVGYHTGFVPDPVNLGRDAGGFAGGSDYGGGGYDFGGSSYDYGGSSGYYHYDDDYSGSGEFGWIDVVVIIVILYLVFGPKPNLGGQGPSDKKRTAGGAQPAGASRTPDSRLRPISALVERDPLFSAAAVEETIANVYVRMQQAWTAGDFEPMRPYFSNTLFSQFANQLAALTRQGRVNHVDNIAVLEASVRGWYESEGFEYLVMKVRTRITDYTLDLAGNVVSGFTDAESYMEYEYTLGRSAGTLTGAQAAQTQADECPNCGAPINLAQSARCAYCGTVVESSRFTWVITAIKGISQQIAK